MVVAISGEREKHIGQVTLALRSSVLWDTGELSPSSKPIVQRPQSRKSQRSPTGAITFPKIQLMGSLGTAH